MQVKSYLDNMAASTEQVISNREAVVQAEKGRLYPQYKKKLYSFCAGGIFKNQILQRDMRFCDMLCLQDRNEVIRW